MGGWGSPVKLSARTIPLGVLRKGCDMLLIERFHCKKQHARGCTKSSHVRLPRAKPGQSVQAPWVAGCGTTQKNIFAEVVKLTICVVQTRSRQAMFYFSGCLLTLYCLPPATKLRVAVAKSVPRGGKTPPALPMPVAVKGQCSPEYLPSALLHIL